MDVKEHSLEEMVHNMGSTLNLEEVHAMCNAHDVPIRDEEKDDMAAGLLDHIVNGHCADRKGPACDNVYEEVTPADPDAIHTQVCVLRHMHPLLSTRQLHKVLNLLGIHYNNSETKKKLKSGLVQNLKKGKLKQSEVE